MKLFKITVNQVVVIIFVSVVAFTPSCGEESRELEKEVKPDYLAIEKKSFDSLLDNSVELKNYKAIKAVLRALGDNTKPEYMKGQSYHVLHKYMSYLYKGQAPSESEILLDLPTLLIIKGWIENTPNEFYSLVEDDYSTLLHAALSLDSSIAVPEFWNAEYEHLLLAYIVDNQNMAPIYSMYEMSQVNASALNESELEVVTYLLKTNYLIQHDLPYMAYHTADSALTTLNNTSDFSGLFSRAWVNTELSQEEIKLGFSALIHLSKGTAAMNMPDEDDRKMAVDEFEKFNEIILHSKEYNHWRLFSELILTANSSTNKSRLLDNVILDEMSFTEKARYSQLVKSFAEAPDKEDYISRIAVPWIITQKLFNYLRESEMINGLLEDDATKNVLTVGANLEKFKQLMDEMKTVGNML